MIYLNLFLIFLVLFLFFSMVLLFSSCPHSFCLIEMGIGIFVALCWVWEIEELLFFLSTSKATLFQYGPFIEVYSILFFMHVNLFFSEEVNTGGYYKIFCETHFECKSISNLFKEKKTSQQLLKEVVKIFDTKKHTLDKV